MNQNPTEQPQEAERIKTIWRTENFIERMEEAVKYHPVSYEELPDKIELEGSDIAIAADLILKDTLEDPLKRERALVGKTSIDGKLVLNKETHIGNEKTVEPVFSLRTRENAENPIYCKSEYPVFMIHTHGARDLPASPQDFESLIGDSDKGAQFQLVLTKSTKMLFLRTLQTGEIDSADDVRKIIEESNKKMDEEVDHAVLKDDLNFKAIWTAKNIKIVLEICRKYKIGAYLSMEGHHYSRIES
ncbi:MAG: hypothetical protein WCF92_00220 [bacterium]